MTARDDILGAIRAQRVRSAQRPIQYLAPQPPAELAETFAARATMVNAEIRFLDDARDIPTAVAEILRGKNLAPEIHIPLGGPDFVSTGLTVKRDPPGPDDAALAFAPFGIAETGTLAYPAGNAAPASWHFRAGLEIAILKAADILPHMENALARIKAQGALPHTINFVTGPSRTGDIEQTLELGAHGPKALAILIIRG
ncbi:MAG TPA: LUD domain-containing protein [Rhizomicrobium sp.]